MSTNQLTGLTLEALEQLPLDTLSYTELQQLVDHAEYMRMYLEADDWLATKGLLPYLHRWEKLYHSAKRALENTLTYEGI